MIAGESESQSHRANADGGASECAKYHVTFHGQGLYHMTLNTVTVTVAAQGSPADLVPPEGHYVFVPNGTMWPATAGALPVVPDIQTGVLVLGTAAAVLVASDNFASGILNWDCIINIQGLPTVNFPGFPVLFALGASQSVWDILAASGWNPVAQP